MTENETRLTPDNSLYLKHVQFFRKLPVEIEAIRFVDDPEVITAISIMADESLSIDYADPASPILKVETLKGTMSAQVGDWIIKGVKGEVCPCKPDIFEKSYAKVDPSDPR